MSMTAIPTEALLDLLLFNAKDRTVADPVTGLWEKKVGATTFVIDLVEVAESMVADVEPHIIEIMKAEMKENGYDIDAIKARRAGV